MTTPATDRGAIALGAVAGVSAWISLGAIAVTSDRLTRVGVLPAVWALAACVAVAIFATWLSRLRRSECWPLALTMLLWLPWLPLPIVSALTIWEGPLEAVVWLVAIGGVLVARFWPAREGFAWVLDRRRGPLLLGALALVASLTTAIALSARIPGGDEPHYLIIAQSLLKDGDLRIQNNHDRGDYFAYFDDGLPPDFLKRGLDGQIYSIHAPGVAVLILPAFALAGYPGSLVFISLLCAAALAVNWRVAMTLTNDAVAAWAGALAVGVSATVFLHSFSIFPDPVGGAVVSVALAMLIRLAVTPDAVWVWHVAATGALVGLLPWLHTRFAVIAGALGVVLAGRLWARADRWQMLGAFAMAPVLLAAGWFSYFWFIYGTFDPSAPYGTGQQSSWRWIGRGAVGLAFDQQFGLIANAPALALLPYGWLRLYRQQPRLALECLVVTAPYVLVVASFGMWWGGWSAPARFLDSVLPIAIPLMALAWRDSNRAVRSMFIALVLIGVANVVLRIVVLDGLLVHNNSDGYDLLLDWVTRAVNLPLAFPGVHRQGAFLAAVLASIWVAAGLVCVTILSALMGRAKTRGALWTLTTSVAVALSSVAMSAAWRVGHAAELTPQSSQIDFIRRWKPDLRPMAFELPRVRLTGVASVPDSLELSSSPRAREASPDPTLLTVAWIPAGEYQVVIEGSSELSGRLSVSIGMTSQTIENWPLDGLTRGPTSLRVSLPALAHSLVVRGDEAARSRVTRVWLRPIGLGSHPERGSEYVLRAARYQHARVFVLDDEVYMEPTGVWTRGNSVARLALTSELLRVPIDVQAGPIETTVRLAVGDWTLDAALAAGERRRIEVPVTGVLTVRTEGSFRPVDYEPASRDARALGARLEFPAP